jgi:putative membrane protein
VLLNAFRAGRNTRSHVWFRFYNEMPVLVLFAVVFLAVLKPF